jgi:hypothetical protein
MELLLTDEAHLSMNPMAKYLHAADLPINEAQGHQVGTLRNM